VALTDLRETGFPSNFSKLQLADLLAERYPEYDWDKVYLLRGRFAQQKRLERATHELFPVNIQRAAVLRCVVLCCIVLWCGIYGGSAALIAIIGKGNYRERKARRRSG